MLAKYVQKKLLIFFGFKSAVCQVALHLVMIVPYCDSYF